MFKNEGESPVNVVIIGHKRCILSIHIDRLPHHSRSLPVHFIIVVSVTIVVPLLVLSLRVVIIYHNHILIFGPTAPHTWYHTGSHTHDDDEGTHSNDDPDPPCVPKPKTIVIVVVWVDTIHLVEGTHRSWTYSIDVAAVLHAILNDAVYTHRVYKLFKRLGVFNNYYG